MKTFKSSYHFPNVLVEMMGKVPRTCPCAFDHFAGRPQVLYLIVSCCEFFYFCIWNVFYDMLLAHSIRNGVEISY